MYSRVKSNCPKLNFVNTTQRDFDWAFETMRYCQFDLKGPRVPKEFSVTKLRSIAPVSLHLPTRRGYKADFNGAVSWWIRAGITTIVLLVHWGNVARRAVIARQAS